jgi:dTDP-4-amino-4,6-dideoxygalactose transaminase
MLAEEPEVDPARSQRMVACREVAIIEHQQVPLGFNYRLDEARAALGVLLLGRLADDNASRARLAACYDSALCAVPGVASVLHDESDTHSAWHSYPLLLDAELDRDAIRAGLHASGVQTSVHYRRCAARGRLLGSPEGAPCDGGLRPPDRDLPLFPGMTVLCRERERVIAQVCNAVGS